MKHAALKSLMFGVALTVAVWSSVAQAQPITATNPQLSIAVVAGADAKQLFTVRASDTSAAAILSLLASKTGVKIIIKKDAPLDDLELKRVTLPEAIAQIAKAANLKLVADKPPMRDIETTYIVGEIEARPNAQFPATPLEMDFKQVPVAQLVKILSEQFGLKAQVAAQVPEKLVDVMIFNATPVEALQIIADAADLEFSKTADGYVLQERDRKKLASAPDLKFRDVPTAQLFKILAEQFGLKIRLAPNLPDKIIDVDFSNSTPVEALQATANAADFEVSNVGDIHIVRERAVSAK